MRRWLWPGVAGMALAAALAATGPALAADPFVDTRALGRHAAQLLPEVPAFDDALTGKTVFPYRRVNAAPFEPGYARVLAAPSPLQAMAGLSGASTVSLAARARAAGDGWAAGAGSRHEAAHAYRDGAGTQVGFGYERDMGWVGGRVGKPEATIITFGGLHDHVDDAKLPNYGLDADRLDQGGLNLGAATRRLPGWFDQGGAALSYGWAHTDVDNFTLRAPGAARINGVGDHQVWKATGWLAREQEGDRTALGVDLSTHRHNAKRYGREYGPDAITGYWVPAVEASRGGLWAERREGLGELTLEGGLRYDAVHNSAEDVHNRPQIGGAAGTVYNLSPQALYDRYYGTGTDNDALDHNVSGRGKATTRLNAASSAWLDVARLVRSPEYGERYTGNSGTTALLEVGNPRLEPEKHHRVSLGATGSGGGFRQYGRTSPAGSWRIEASLSHDRVEDFATIDTARGQPGVLRSDGAVVYRNVDAAVSAVAGDAQAMLAERLGARLTLLGQRGRNLTDHRPLHQMAPVEANLFLDYLGGDDDRGWNVGARARLVAAKRAVDGSTVTGSGQDTGGPAGGFATFDLYSGINLGQRVWLSAGVENLFDQLYREHVKGLPQISAVAPPNAPGRTLVLRGVVGF